MIRKILSLIVLSTVVAGISLNGEPTPSTDRTSSKNTKKVEGRKPQAKTDAAAQTVSALPLAEGWNYVMGEWIHSDGYKYVKGQIIRIGTHTHKSPPKPPSKSLLDSVKTRPAPSPAPNSADAKALQKQRNLRPRPASQTGSHL